MRKARNRAGPPIFRLGISPLDRFLQYDAVGGIFGGESAAFVLHAEHDERPGAVVAYRALSCRGNPHDTPFGYGEDLPVHLEFARPAEEEVEFLVISVDMQETAFRSGHERLEREFAAGGLYGCAAEHLSGNFHSGTEFHNIVVQFV